MRVLTFLPPCSYFYFWFLIALAISTPCCLSLENSNKLLCIERERVALVQFKHDLVFGGGCPLNSWDGKEKDCCKWGGVVCDNFTGHVKQIRLRGPDLFENYGEPKYGSIHAPYEDFIVEAGYRKREGEILRGKINPSLQHLEQLEYLDLSCNNFGSINIPGFIGSLRKLRYLNISNSEFTGEIPHQLGNLSQLHVLGLSNYQLNAGTLEWLSSLSRLQHLDMSHVDLSKAFDWLQVINALPSLVELHLSDCYLYQLPLPLNSVNHTSLSVLDLSSNSFDYATVPGWIFNITSLVSLDLSGCLLQAPISRSSDGFHKSTSLQRLIVSNSHFVNSSWFVKGLSSVGSTLVSVEMRSCGLSSSILRGFRNLTSLVRLDLSGNMLHKAIPESLGNLCDLKHIDLSLNDFGGISSSEVLDSFFKCESPKLESLTILSSNLSGHLPNQIGTFHKLANLQLQENSISGPIPSSMGQLDKLANLQLQKNSISGLIPNSIGSLSSLEVLDLSHNLFSGAIPDHIGSLSSLKQLDLSYNQLNGSIPETIGQIPNLEYLNIENNLLTGVVTENHFTNLTALKQFSASRNILTLIMHLLDWVPPFQLMILELQSWSLGPHFPSWLQSQKELIALDISNSRIPYSIPEWVWTVSSRLLFLNLSHNGIQGKLVTRIPASLSLLDLSSNNFSGSLPELSKSSEIAFLDLSKNSFSGSLKHLLCPVIQAASTLNFLNLADNDLSGVLPNCWKQWEYLEFVNLENNNLSGGIPKSLWHVTYLWSLNLRNNKLSGQLTASVVDLTRLRILQLGGNEFTGTIPTWIEGLTHLLLLDLRSNKFVGDIPYQLCHITSIQILVLAHNNLTGVIPSCFRNFSSMSGTGPFTRSKLIRIFRFGWLTSQQDVAVSASLVVKGREDMYRNFLGLVTLMDLSSNCFSGHIPTDITSLVGLLSLNLSRNNLTGGIPGNIGDMKSLESLDLSVNNLDGEIPVSLSSLTYLSRLNFSFNHLRGSIPTSTQLQGLDNSSFIGNRLCGPPLIESCPVATPSEKVDEKVVKEGSRRSHDWGLIISIVLGFAAGFWVVVGPLVISRLWRIVYFSFLDKVRLRIYEFVVNIFSEVF